MDPLRPYRDDWPEVAETLIARWRAQGAYKLRDPGCYDPRSLDLRRRAFHYNGKGRDFTLEVRLARPVFIHLVRAMIDEPDIQLWGPLSSFRSCITQGVLYDRYLSGGPKATPPGEGYHPTGRSVDLYEASHHEQRAMEEQGFENLYPLDPPHWTFRALG